MPARRGRSVRICRKFLSRPVDQIPGSLGDLMITIQTRRAANGLLRWFGLDPGRSVSNAIPDGRQVRRDRIQQFAYIADRLASADDQLAVVARHVDEHGGGELSIAVFDRDGVVTRHAPLDRPLGDVIGTGRRSERR